jgi:hypothetical protein
MRRILFSALAAFLVTVSTTTSVDAGIIIVNHDEWTLSNSGFSNAGAANAATFVNNTANLFAGGLGGNFLIYSNNFGLTQSSFLNTLDVNHDHDVTTNPALFTLANLQNYDGVFLAGGASYSYNPAILAAYVNAGGNVYIAAGTGDGGATVEANAWNPFLNQFGLAFQTQSYNGVGGNLAIPNPSPHPIFNGVTQLFYNNGNDALDIQVSDPQGRVLITQGGHGLWAIYEPASNAIPEPSSLLIMGGLLGIVALRRRRPLGPRAD